MLGTLFTGFFLLASLMLGSAAEAHADPYCGSGSNYDWRHDICQPGAPVPPGRDSQGVGVFPYPLPGQNGPGGYGPPSYGGN